MINENETPETREMREQLQRIAALLAAHVGAVLKGSAMGFALGLYDNDQTTLSSMAYAADGNRQDMVKLGRELADKIDVDKVAAHMRTGKTDA